MKQLFIVGNWKSHKTLAETIDWLRFMKERKDEMEALQHKTVIVCPPFQLLYNFAAYGKEYALPISIGAQDISPFDEGAYTGEVNGKQLKEFADYVIIGHSERRIQFHETDDMLEKKVAMAKKYGLKVIYCVQNEETPVPENVAIIAYEPVFAIDTGNPDTPENAENVCAILKKNHPSASIIYGGSVTGENVKSFTSQQHIEGILPGGASLDPEAFLSITQNA